MDSLIKLNRSRLADKARRGDTAAFAELYGEIYKELYYYALANLNNPDDAADAVSDCVLDAFVGINKLKNPDLFKGWMFKILTAKIKKKQREYSKERNQRNDIKQTKMPSCEGEFASVEILAAFNELSNDEKRCIALNCIAGYKGEEISKMTGIPHSTVRSHISRGRAKLKLREDEVLT